MHAPSFKIYEANEHVTAHLATLERSSDRMNDLRAALDFLLARDPTCEAIKLGNKDGLDTYIKATSSVYPGVPQLLLLYTVDNSKKEVVIHAGRLIQSS